MTTPATLHEWFERSASLHPDAVALEVGDRALTYRELDNCAGQVAQRVLREHGRRPGLVGLLANRSLAAFAGYLAAQRLGATVMPLHPDLPVPRNQAVVTAGAPEVVLADESGRAHLESGLDVGAASVLRLDDAELTGRPAGGRGPVHQAAAEDVAYLLFTSGSTGRPKGVPIRHRNVSPYLAHNIVRYQVGPGCRMSHTFDLTFDPSVFDLFATWGGGATLVCPQRAELLDPVRYLVDRRITHWFSVPSVVSVAERLGNLGSRQAPDVRHSTFIGEQLSRGQAATWHAAVPGSTLDNVYGPTELTVACTEYRLPDDPDRWPETSNDTVPIGPVYDFLDHVVVGDDGLPAAEGELCVRGPQRFDGYLDPRDDVGRFVVERDGRFVAGTADAGGYYRTGDRVRREHGVLLHLGRLDHQVKVRGYRVELGDIETVLTRHPGVRQAVVVASRSDDETLLDACYSGEPVPERELRRWLRARLPVHMVPRRLHHLDAMPLNPNGKVDRTAVSHRVQTDRHALDAAASNAGR